MKSERVAFEVQCSSVAKVDKNDNRQTSGNTNRMGCFQMKRFYFFILFFHVICLFPNSISNVYAQPVNLHFKHLTPDDGLSSSSIECIIQDYKGFVWIGTYDGLNRYDGFSFSVYKNNPADSASLIDNHIISMLETKDGNLFIGTNSGLCMYNRKNDCFLNYLYDRSSPLSGKRCVVSNIAEDALGNLWLATDMGLIYFDRINNRIIQFTHDPKRAESLSCDYVNAVWIDKLNRLWVGTREGLNLFLSETGTFQHIFQVENEVSGIHDLFISNMTGDLLGNLWIGCKEGLFCVENYAANKIGPMKHFQHNPQDKNSLSINQVGSLFVDDKNNLWVGTENSGLNLFDRKNNSFWHYHKDDYDPMSLNNESINAIYNDKTGNMWVGTFSGGLNVTTKNRESIVHFQVLPGAPFSLSYNTVTCFLEDHNNQYWVGTDGGGLNFFDSQTNRFLCYNIDNSSLSSNAILSMIEDSKHLIWLGTWAGGLVCFDTKTKSFKSYTTGNSGIQDDNIFVVTEGYQDDLWLGSFEKGLIHYQIKEKRFTSFTPENSGIINKMIVKIVKYSKGRLLIGCPNGLQIFSPKENQFVTYLPDPKNTNSLCDQKIVDILVQNDSCVWIGTNNGLNLFNPTTGTFKRYFEQDGLPGNLINGLSSDRSDVLWVTTNKGVCRYDHKLGKFKNFTKADGLQSNEFSARSILRTKSGALLMGGTKGFNIVYPDKIVENKSIPDVLITDLKILNKRIEPGAENSPLVHNITETKALTLSYKQSVITFDFAVMDFTAPEKNQYAHKMKGFDDDWIYFGNKREATYTNLDPGEYVLQVKGSNNDGVWNEKGVSLKIIITPPWWKSLWFRVGMLFVVLFSLFFAYYMRIRLYREKQKELSVLVEKRTCELTSANKELLERQILIESQTEELVKLNSTKDRILSIIAHDLRNPFNVVSGFSGILLEDLKNLPLETIEMYLKHIYNSSENGNTLLGNLLQWSSSQTGRIKFESIRINLFQVAKESSDYLMGDAHKKNINIQLTVDRDLYVVADENMLKTIFRNLLSNAIKFTPNNGKITVIAESNTEKAEICVCDSGVGIPPERISRLFKFETNTSTKGTSNEPGTGLGLILAKEFIDRHLEKIWVESKVGVGTQFKFTLPLS
jgi:ligand-binding sensor domain-containing protein/signal transduction histidine kinase